MKSVLITGCSTGIGFCIALGLQKKGYRVFPTARTNEDVKKLKDLGFEALYLDLAISDSIKSAVFKLYEKTGARFTGRYKYLWLF